MENFEDEYKMNFFLKTRAQDYIRNPNDSTMTDLLAEIVIRIEDGCESRKAEGIILNLHSEEVFIGKAELDWVLDVLMQREAKRAG